MTLLEKIGMLLGEDILLEVTADEKYNKQYAGKLERGIFDKAISIDPTSNPQGQDIVGQYVDWLIRRWPEISKGDISTDEIKKYLDLFKKHGSKLDPQYKDINKFKSVKEWIDVVKQAEAEGKFESKKSEKDLERQKVEAESKLIYNDPEFTIVSPDTIFASRYLGSGAKWCTAWQDDRCMFPYYNKAGTLYIIIDKKNKVNMLSKQGTDLFINNKWQIFLPNKEGGRPAEMRDWSNDSFSPWATFKGKAVLKKIEELGFTEPGRIGNIDEFIKDTIIRRELYLKDTEEIHAKLKEKVEELMEDYRDIQTDDYERAWVEARVRYWLHDENGMDDILIIDDNFLKTSAKEMIEYFSVSESKLSNKNIKIVMEFLKKEIENPELENSYKKVQRIDKLKSHLDSQIGNIKRKILSKADISMSVGDNFSVMLGHLGENMYDDFKKNFNKTYSKENWYYNYYDIDKFIQIVMRGKFPNLEQSSMAKYYEHKIKYDDIDTSALIELLEKIYSKNAEEFKDKYHEIVEYFSRNSRDYIPMDEKQIEELKGIFDKIEAKNAQEDKAQQKLKLFPKVPVEKKEKESIPARTAKEILAKWEPELEDAGYGNTRRVRYKEPYYFDRIDLPQLRKELEKEYVNDTDNFEKYLYNEIVDRFNSKQGMEPMTDKEKEVLKDMFDEIKATGYRKATRGVQQKLKLNVPKITREQYEQEILDYLL